jgi:hypothetical protein
MVVSGERSGKVAGRQKGERGGRAGRGTLRVIVRSGNSQNRESKMGQNVGRENQRETWGRCAERWEGGGDDHGGRLECHGGRERKKSVRLLIWVRMTNIGGLTLQ